MVKKESLTKAYIRTVGDVYREEGFLAAAKYELASTWHSIVSGKRNLDDGMYPGSDSEGRPWPEGSCGREDYRDAQRRIAYRKQEKADYLLRHKSKDKGNCLEKATATVALVGLVGGAFFYSTKITGNVVGVSMQTSSLIGVGLIIIGIVAGYFWLKGKKKAIVEKKVFKKKK